ncbi:MAG: polysaccharide biosynthesis protein, partial [Kordiimonadaceae bacterium]|nr:polysaccharide biosynthesis protein [Kordiimonadaceae bacterium]
NSEYKVKYFIDEDKRIQSRSIDGVAVLSTSQFKNTSMKSKVDMIIIAIPSAKQSRINEIYEELNGFSGVIKVLPSLDNILQDKPMSNQLKNVDVEDLLARHPKGLDKTVVKNFIKDKVIMVTGAGGSIGSEICRQCCIYGAKEIILVEHGEYNLYAIDQELSEFRNNGLVVSVVPKMVNVKDQGSLDEVFTTYKPNIVVHAAAYKHVPMVEDNISQGIANNVMGTKTSIDLA